jgi:two-component system, NtrC family, nitrogen regulation sensor histidine kinase NtrY
MLHHFSIGLAWRIGLIVLFVALGTSFFLTDGHQSTVMPFFCGVGVVIVTASLYRYVTGANRKIARFFDAVRYSDFTSSFRADNPQGATFQELNRELNAVLEAFRQARAEKEINLQYLNTIVHHISVGLLAYAPANDEVALSNPAALRLLGVYRLRNLSDLDAHNQVELARQLRTIRPGASVLATTAEGEPVSLSAVDVRLRGRALRLISLQNIRSELQQKEVEAWQNLTKVLRHEIMNSLTPIITLTGTMRDMVEHPMPGQNNEDDLKLALSTIERRTQGLVRFVDSYRSLTNLPAPHLQPVVCADFIRHIANLMTSQLNQEGIQLRINPPDKKIWINADTAQLEMALLNLLRNAAEALRGQPEGIINLDVRPAGNLFIEIRVADNGPGIPENLLDQIFIPFFTSKPTGTGVGLSVSRQIAQSHRGDLQVASKPGEGALFTLRLPAYE